MKIQNKLARYINNTTVSNKEVQVNKMVKAIALAERELEQARALFADFNSAPVPPAPKKSILHSGMGEMTSASEVQALVFDADKTAGIASVVAKTEVKPVKEVKPLVLPDTPVQGLVLPDVEPKGLVLPGIAPKTLVEPEKAVDGLVLPGVKLVDKVKENIPAPAKSTGPKAGFISGPVSAKLVLNSGRPSYKHDTIAYTEKLRVFMYTGIMKLAEAGVCEIRVPELDGVELMMALVWESVIAKYPNMKMVLYTNNKTVFKQYKEPELEKAAGIYSPARLSRGLRHYATKVVEVNGSAFDVRWAVAKDTVGYVRVSPFGVEDVSTPLYQGKALTVSICPWTLAVEIGGELTHKSVPADGNDYRPTNAKPKETVEETVAPAEEVDVTLAMGGFDF